MPSYIYPPRPRITLPPGELDEYERSGRWVADPKFEGARNLVKIKDGEVELFGRHGGRHLSFDLSVTLKNEILNLPGLVKGVEYWLDSELMIKTKAADTKGKIIFYDVLFMDKYLFMKPDQMGRKKLLDEICGNPVQLDVYRGMAYQISENLLMSPTYEFGFSDLFKSFDYDEVEGLVLRRRNSTIDNFGQKPYEAYWLARCRRRNKKSDF